MNFDLNKYINLQLLSMACRKETSVTVNSEDGLNQFFSMPLHMLKALAGDRVSASLHFSGALMLKFGISSNCRAYRWFGEKKLVRMEEGSEEFEINLANFDSGTLEIYVRSLTKSATLFCHASPAQKRDLFPERVLYDFVSPSYELCSEESLYYRFAREDKGAYYSYEDKAVHLASGASVDLVTFFNAFSSCKWKKYTNVDTVSVYLDFEGVAIAQLVHVTPQGENILESWQLNAGHRAVLELPVGSFPDTGIMGLRLYAEKTCILHGGGYLTDASQTQDVHLGIGITTYRRENAVIASVARLGKAIASHPLYHDSIDITVVDNGQTLSAEDLPEATLIPNANLGGTGGFMRNLLHYQDGGVCTHCVFMDDDASCEPGCVFRSISFLRHATDSSIAISGAMLIDTAPAVQWEKGAYFDGTLHAVHSGLNVSGVAELVENELEETGKTQLYGAWWFFMFPLKKVEMTVFPYFVRGDDIEFSYTNKFNIVTMNGIASLQGNFKLKDCPLTYYFSLRSTIVLNYVLNNGIINAIKLVKLLCMSFIGFNLTYHYDSANVVVLAMKNVAKGPAFWIDDITTAKIREYIKKNYKIEISKPVDIQDAFLIKKEKKRYSFIKKILIIMTLNGHLLPSAMLDRKRYYIDKFCEGVIPNVYSKQSVIVYDELNKVGYELRRNCSYFLKNIISMSFYTCLFLVRFSFAKRAYRAFYKKLKKGAFWRTLYKK